MNEWTLTMIHRAKALSIALTELFEHDKESAATLVYMLAELLVELETAAEEAAV